MKKVLKVLLIIIIFSIGFLLVGYLPNQQIKNNKNEKNKTWVFLNKSSHTDERIEVLRKEFGNEDIKAIISSESIGLESIVVQSSDNIYYMDHDVNQKYDKVGSIFIDYRNDFNSKKILIYGHNAQTLETDFGKLEKYLDPTFAKNNPYITLITDDGITTWEIFSVMIVPNNTTSHTRIEFSSVKQLEDHLDWMRTNSKVKFDVSVDINDQLMTLQTCYYEPKDSFLLINLKKVEENNG